MSNVNRAPYRWTSQAVYCYIRGCVCEGCSYNIPLESIKQCQTKNAVLELVRTIGKPKENLLLAEYGLRRCTYCGKVKKIEEFHKYSCKAQPSHCAECTNKLGVLYREKKKQQRKEHQNEACK